MKRYFFSLFILSLFLMPLSAQKANKSTKTGKWGFMNGSTWVVEPKFENYDPANAFGGRKYAIVQFQGKWGAVGADGKYYSKPVFATKELALRAAKLAVTGGDKSKFLYPVYDQTYTRWGFVDYTGEMYLRPVYEEVDDANNFSKGLPYSIVKQDGQWGCLDREGVMFINPYFTSKDEAKKAVTEWTNKAVLGENIYIGMDLEVTSGFIEGCTVASMKPDPNDPRGTRLVKCIIQGNDAWPGEEITVNAGKGNDNYKCVVPASAVNQDNSNDFVYVIEGSSTPLGDKYTVKRVDVTVEATDGSACAIKGEGLDKYDVMIVVRAEKPLEDGQRVRLEDYSAK